MIRIIDEVEIESKRVLVRVDFNCPMENGAVLDDSRIRAALPTIRHALKRRAKVVVMSHLGRPDGKRVPELSLEPVGIELAKLLDTDVVLADDCVGDGARKVVADLYGGRIALLENLRFHPGESSNDEHFSRELAAMADVYVNDAFGTLHRAHASVVGVPQLLRERCAGLLVKREVDALSALLGDVKKPYVVILGGSKVEYKIRTIHSLLGRADALLIGGAMANTFLAARGTSMGKSLLERESFLLARSVLADAARRSIPVILPQDLVVATSPDSTERRIVPVTSVPPDMMALDIGPATIAAFGEHIDRAATIFWNGPMGLFEKPPFHEGTVKVAEMAGTSMGFKVVGGGDSVEAVRMHCLNCRFDHLSTGGGASLKFLEGKELAGLTALEAPR